MALYELSRALTGTQGRTRVTEVSAGHMERVFECRVSVFTPDAGGRLTRVYASSGLEEPSERDVSISHWVWANRREAGLGTTTLPGAPVLYIPLMASGGIVGVLGLGPQKLDRFDSIEQRRQADAFATQMAVAMERAELAEETDKARREMEKEQLRSSLLSSVSHDLRTPLAVITGAASTIVEGGAALDEATRNDLVKTILEEAERLNHLIRNLLDMTRLESGVISVKKESVPLEEVVGAALNRLDARLAGRDVRVTLPRDIALVPLDPVLIEQVFINLLENAAKHAAGSIEITATPMAGEMRVEVADRGPGIPPGEEARVFDKFHRVTREGSPGGVGLGLAICRAVVAAHGGRIWVQSRDGGGASFRFTLPLPGEAPNLVFAESDEAVAPEGGA